MKLENSNEVDSHRRGLQMHSGVLQNTEPPRQGGTTKRKLERSSKGGRREMRLGRKSG